MTPWLPLYLKRSILACLWLELAWMMFCGVGFSGQQAVFFSAGVDPVSWIWLCTRLPQFIWQNSIAGYLLDAVLLLLLAYLIWKPASYRVARMVFILNFVFYVMLTLSLGHRNFQAGFVWVLLPFLWNNEQATALSWRGLRYFALFFYASAGLLKLFTGVFIMPDHFSNILEAQWAIYALEGSGDLRLPIISFVINHSVLAQSLFILAGLVELAALTGFFTRAYDRLIFMAILLFHLFNWVLMDIAPIGHMSFLILCILWSAYLPKKER